MIEGIIVAAIFHFTGYLHRYFTAPVKKCKVLEYQIPEPLKYPLNFAYCKEGTEPITGLDKECYVSLPLRYSYTPENWDLIENQYMQMQAKVFECDKLIKEYNNNKFIMIK